MLASHPKIILWHFMWILTFLLISGIFPKNGQGAGPGIPSFLKKEKGATAYLQWTNVGIKPINHHEQNNPQNSMSSYGNAILFMH